MDRARTWRTTRRSARVDLGPDAVWQVLASGEPGPQWYVDAAPFVARRWVDRLVLGPGLRRPPPGRALLREGDRVGFWEVARLDVDDRTLRLRAEVRAPGRVELEARAAPDGDGSVVSVAVTLDPDGLLGRAYLVLDLPAREAVTELVLRHLLGVLRRHDNPRASGSVEQA